MTGYVELEDAIAAINRGHVYHYLLKPWRAEELRQVLRHAAEKFTLERNREELLEQMRQLNRDLEQRVAERTRELEEANHLLEQRSRELERLALTDPLTGLFNRRAMEELARFELKRHARYPSPLTLGYIDVDHFKQVNTDYLLTGGDEVLRGLARVLLGTLREVDSVGRIGGEEFLVIARETNEEGRRHPGGAHPLHGGDRRPIEYMNHSISITVSVGFAVAEVGVPADYQEMIGTGGRRPAHRQGNRPQPLRGSLHRTQGGMNGAYRASPLPVSLSATEDIDRRQIAVLAVRLQHAPQHLPTQRLHKRRRAVRRRIPSSVRRAAATIPCRASGPSPEAVAQRPPRLLDHGERIVLFAEQRTAVSCRAAKAADRLPAARRRPCRRRVGATTAALRVSGRPILLAHRRRPDSGRSAVPYSFTMRRSASSRASRTSYSSVCSGSSPRYSSQSWCCASRCSRTALKKVVAVGGQLEDVVGVVGGDAAAPVGGSSR